MAMTRVSSSSATLVMNDFSMCTGELGGSTSDMWAAELGVAAMVEENGRGPGCVREGGSGCGYVGGVRAWSWAGIR